MASSIFAWAAPIGPQVTKSSSKMRKSAALLLGAHSAVAGPRPKPSIMSDTDVPAPALRTIQKQGRGWDPVEGVSRSADEQSRTKDGLQAAAYPTTATDPMTRATTSPSMTPTPTAIPGETNTTPTRLATNTSVSITTALTPPTPFINATTTLTINPPVPTRTSKSLIPYWSYKKSCIAAASIISAVALVAFIFLSVVYLRRLKKRWDQYKQVKRNKRNRKKESTSTAYSAIPLSEDHLVTESKLAADADGRTSSDRESLMFSESYSPSTAFKVDEPRTYRAYNSSSHSGSGTAGAWTEGLTTPLPAAFGAASGNTEISPSHARADRTGLVPASPATRACQYAPYVRPVQRESPAKPVVVRPSAYPAVPMSARPSSVAEERATLQDQPVLSRASVYDGQAARRSVEISGAGSSRPPESIGLARLPSIKRSQSPLFNFEDV